MLRKHGTFFENNTQELEALYERLRDKSNMRGRENEPRVGRDWHEGADITGEEFGKTFGFRGVQFGNYLNGKERQTAINEAYDGLMDLAAVLGVEPRALSLNGELGLAFGARGKGAAGKMVAAAHYEPNHVVINLTKKQGAGSLAHEWWHGLNNYFSRKEGEKHAFITQRRKTQNTGTPIRREVHEAFNDVMTALDGDLIKGQAIWIMAQKGVNLTGQILSR